MDIRDSPERQAALREPMSAIADPLSNVQMRFAFRAALVPGFEALRFVDLGRLLSGILLPLDPGDALGVGLLFGALGMNPADRITDVAADRTQARRFAGPRRQRIGLFDMHG